MTKVFGMPVGPLAAVLSVALLLVLAIVGILALRNPVLVRLAL